VTTYISDNPAILSLAEDEGFDKYFTQAEKATYVNLGTTFGMGLIVTAYMLSLGSEYFTAVLVGNIGAIIGGIASVRVMLRIAKKYYHEDKHYRIETGGKNIMETRKIRNGGRIIGEIMRLINAIIPNSDMSPAQAPTKIATAMM